MPKHDGVSDSVEFAWLEMFSWAAQVIKQRLCGFQMDVKTFLDDLSQIKKIKSVSRFWCIFLNTLQF